MNKENELQISSCISTKQCSNTTADAWKAACGCVHN
jgi:hypothetical protein